MLAWSLYRKKNPLRIKATAYDGAAIGLLIIMLLILRGRFAELVTPYFNAASDQYYWLAYAEASLHDATFTLSKIFVSQIHRPIFFLLLGPYIAFFPKDMATYQNFMILWTYGIYALVGIAITELAYICLSRKMLGLIAMPMLFSLHWLNYYLISGDIAPQGMGIFLFIVGFIILYEKTELGMIWLFLALFYAIHLGTLAIFGLIVGIAVIIREGIVIVRGEKNRDAPWHVFEKLFLLPAAIVVILYALYAAQILQYFDRSLIAYDSEYSKNLTLFSQPYLGREQEVILWTGIIGLFLAAFKRKRLAITTGFALPWIFLITPLVAYHAFYASWQSFRYYLFLYPSAVILGLLLVEWCADGIAWISSFRISKGFVFILVIGLLPIFVIAASNQEKLVFLDMIQGRDEGARAIEQRKKADELLAIAKYLPETSRNPIMISPKDSLTTVMQWTFAPRETIVTQGPCTEMSCPAYSTLRPQLGDFLSFDPRMIVIAKEGGGDEIGRRILTGFDMRGESDSFLIYMKR
jgi:hypothetical protein